MLTLDFMCVVGWLSLVREWVYRYSGLYKLHLLLSPSDKLRPHDGEYIGLVDYLLSRRFFFRQFSINNMHDF